MQTHWIVWFGNERKEGIVLDDEGELNFLLTGDRSQCTGPGVSALADDMRERYLGEEVTVQSFVLNTLDMKAMVKMEKMTIQDKEEEEEEED